MLCSVMYSTRLTCLRSLSFGALVIMICAVFAQNISCRVDSGIFKLGYVNGTVINELNIR